MVSTQFASGRESLPAITATNTSGGTITGATAGTYYFWIQGRNDIGFNKPSTSVSCTVAVNEKIVLTIPATAYETGENWLEFYISASTTNDPSTSCVVAVRANYNSSQVFLSLPDTIELTEDEHLLLNETVTTLPSTALNGSLRKLSSNNFIYRFIENYSGASNGVTVIDATGGKWVKFVDGFNINVTNTVSSSKGCDQSLSATTDLTRIENYEYAANGSSGKYRNFWIRNNTSATIPKGTRVGITVNIDGVDQSTKFNGLLKVIFVGYVDTDTGILDITSDNSLDPMPGVGTVTPYAFSRTNIVLQKDLEPDISYSLKVYPEFNAYNVNVATGSTISIYPFFYSFNGAYSDLGTLTGDLIFSDENYRRVVPGSLLSLVALPGSGIVKSYSFTGIGEQAIFNLVANTADQNILIDGNGTCYVGNSPGDLEALRAVVSTESGESRRSGYSNTISGASGATLSISISHPYTGSTARATIRSDYPDVCSGLQGVFNPVNAVIYVEDIGLGEIRKFTVGAVSTAVQTTSVTWSSGTVVSSYPTIDDDFSLYAPNSATINSATSGSATTYRVSVSYSYTGNQVTRINHSTAVGCIVEALNTLDSFINDSQNYKASVTGLANLRAITDVDRSDYEVRPVINGLSSTIFQYLPSETTADNGVDVIKPNDVSGAGRYVAVHRYSNTYVDSELSAHIADSDPHTQYLNNSRGDVRYPRKDNTITPSNGQTLVYNDTSGLWEPGTVAGSNSGGGPSVGSLLFQFNSATTGAPGDGYVLLSNTLFDLSTSISISDLDYEFSDISSYFSKIALNNILRIQKKSDGKYLDFLVTSNGSYNGTTHATYSISYMGGSYDDSGNADYPSFSDDDYVHISWLTDNAGIYLTGTPANIPAVGSSVVYSVINSDLLVANSHIHLGSLGIFYVSSISGLNITLVNITGTPSTTVNAGYLTGPKIVPAGVLPYTVTTSTSPTIPAVNSTFIVDVAFTGNRFVGDIVKFNGISGKYTITAKTTNTLTLQNIDATPSGTIAAGTVVHLSSVSGSGGSSTYQPPVTTIQYSWSTVTSGTPNSGEIYVNNSSLGAISSIVVHEFDTIGADRTTALDEITNGDWIRLSKSTGEYFEYKINSTPVDNGVYRTYSVSLYNYSSSLPTFSASEVINFSWAADYDPATGSGRVMLTADRTYYVRTDGTRTGSLTIETDATSNTSGDAFGTISNALAALRRLDFNGFTPTLSVQAGTFTEIVELPNLLGATTPLLQGAGIASTTIQFDGALSGLQTHYGVIQARNISTVWKIKDVKITTTANNRAAILVDTAKLLFETIQTDSHYKDFNCLNGSQCEASGNYTLSRSKSQHIYCEGNGSFKCQQKAVTLSGTPNFSVAFADVSYGPCVALINLNTYSGSATGQRYQCIYGGRIITSAAGLPGSTAGVSTPEGFYNAF